MTAQELIGCEDCPADVRQGSGVSGITGDAVLIVVVAHDESCPWAARCVDADGTSIVATARGVLIHVAGALS